MNAARPNTRAMVWNIVSLNVGWWSCVLDAVHGTAWIGPLIVLALVCVHLCIVPARRREVVTLFAVAVLGYVADSALVLAGIIDFPLSARLGAPSTLWMVALWVNFATSLNLALYWLARRPWLAAILGAAGAPTAYYSGTHLGALLTPAGATMLVLAVALEWAVATPLMLEAALRIGRWARQPVPLEAATAGSAT